MKTIFTDVAVEKTAATEQREALQTLRKVVAAYEGADAEARERA